MIEADIVFEKLFQRKYVSRFQWKNINKDTSKYQVAFYCEKCELTALHCFEIYVKDGKHYIRNTELQIFLALHGIKIDLSDK